MKKLLTGLNKEQLKAVKHTEGPVIIFAGAGSGKTRILTRRAAYLIQNGIANPKNILAITFTNKAAEEMKSRIRGLVGPLADSMWISTFHSMCARILRKNAHCIGYNSQFTIYDMDDSKSILKKIIKSLGYEKEISEKVCQWMISKAKNAGHTAEEYARISEDEKISKCFEVYEESMLMNNCMDFDDLLLKTWELFDSCPDVLEEYQKQFLYIMVDEYQDTNHIQFELVKQLSGGTDNVCVVGDDDQSIYKFRGADITNILNFESYFPTAKRILMEENYRSTKNILDTANAVISNNRYRKAKRLWTTNPNGNKVSYISFHDAEEEADYIISDIKKSDWDLSNIAILYRSNMQSRLIEEACLTHNIPYRIIGGINFYQRKEIKDMISYLKILVNPSDEVCVKRILNVPKRGIGNKTIDKIDEYASLNKLTFYEALKKQFDIPGISSKTRHAIEAFCLLIEKNINLFTLSKLPETTTSWSVSSYLNAIANKEGYFDELAHDYDPEEYASKKENINEFINKIISLESSMRGMDLQKFLEDIALISEKKEEVGEKVTMMTLHASKGLEFKKVYIVGMNTGLFPCARASHGGEELEEERRLCYVGITRAMESLTLTSCRYRMINGRTSYMPESIFVNELPDKNVSITRM